MNKLALKVHPGRLWRRAWRRGVAIALVLMPALMAGQTPTPTPAKPPDASAGQAARSQPPCQPKISALKVKPAEPVENGKLPKAVSIIVDKDTNIGTGVFKITYEGDASCPITLQLSATDFKSATTGKMLGAVPATFTPVDSVSKAFFKDPPDAMKKGDTATVKIDVPKLWEAGESAGLLMQNGKEIASITASKLRVPFAVKNGTPTGEEDGLFYPSKGGSLTVANDDAMTYPVSWKLWIDDRLAAEGNDTLQPSSSNHLQIKPDNDFYTWPSSGMLQDDLAKARLSLRFAPPGVLQDTTLPIKDIGYKIRLRYFSKGYQQIWNLVWVFLFLTAGAAISIAANVGIPNQTQRNAVHKQLRELGDRINALGPAADSSAVTFLRVERSRLEKRLHDTNFFSPNLAADLPQIRQGIDLLNSRVQVISEIRDLQEALHQTPSVSPSIMDSGLRTCRKNLKTAVQPDLSAQDISNVRASNAAVQQQLDSLGQDDPVLSAAILARETALKNRLPQAGQQDPAWQVFSPELQGILQSVMNAPAGISPDEYYNRDMATQIAMACADYVAYRKLLSDPEVIARVESEAANAKGMQEQTYPALLRGRSILECIRQNAPASRVLEALQSTPPKAEIQVTPSTPSTYDLVSLQVRFLDPALNIDAVHQQFTCKWEVEHLPPKEGWSISHYFTKWSTKKRRANEEQQKTDQGPPQANQIVVKFFDNNQNPVIQKSGTAPVKLEKTVSVQQGARPSRILIEVIRTGLVLLVALLGLVATAQDKIANLNIVQAMLAVLLLGITADTVKNLLAKSA